MRYMKNTAQQTWLVWDEPLPMGQTISSGAAVYEWKTGSWSCDKCGYFIGSKKLHSLRPHCDHIEFVKNHKEGR